MRKFIPLLFLLTACANLGQLGHGPLNPTAAIAQIRVDVSDALDGAQKAGDQIGIQCHQKTLATLDRIADTKVSGVASAAQLTRNVSTMLAENIVACSQVYDLRQLFAPLFPAVPLLAKVLGGLR